ncbi:MAG: hypothetical protein PHG67_10370 [Bacteroidales bacterium]|nr:hypothetical protein [Bacteroidales bacterium]
MSDESFRVVVGKKCSRLTSSRFDISAGLRHLRFPSAGSLRHGSAGRPTTRAQGIAGHRDTGAQQKLLDYLGVG